jgi:hypothetical protein
MITPINLMLILSNELKVIDHKTRNTFLFRHCMMNPIWLQQLLYLRSSPLYNTTNLASLADSISSTERGDGSRWNILITLNELKVINHKLKLVERQEREPSPRSIEEINFNCFQSLLKSSAAVLESSVGRLVLLEKLVTPRLLFKVLLWGNQLLGRSPPLPWGRCSIIT